MQTHIFRQARQVIKPQQIKNQVTKEAFVVHIKTDKENSGVIFAISKNPSDFSAPSITDLLTHGWAKGVASFTLKLVCKARSFKAVQTFSVVPFDLVFAVTVRSSDTKEQAARKRNAAMKNEVPLITVEDLVKRIAGLNRLSIASHPCIFACVFCKGERNGIQATQAPKGCHTCQVLPNSHK
jgi:hypothetical protein